jgi:hypothetical protein
MSPRFNSINELRFAIDAWTVFQMTFIIEAIKEDRQTTDFRSSSLVAVMLARKLAEDGFVVSITAPTGRLYSADKFSLMLETESAYSSDRAALGQ